jgi:hypothetical protein
MLGDAKVEPDALSLYVGRGVVFKTDKMEPFMAIVIELDGIPLHLPHALE